MKAFHAVVVALIVIGALNWGLVGLFQFDLVAFLLGPGSMLSRVVYVLVGLAGVIAIYTEFAVHRTGNALPGGRAAPQH